MDKTQFSRKYFHPIVILTPLALLLVLALLSGNDIFSSLKDIFLYGFPWAAQFGIYNYPILLNLVHHIVLGLGLFLIIKKPLGSVKKKTALCLLFHTLNFGIIILNIGIDAGSI